MKSHFDSCPPLFHKGWLSVTVGCEAQKVAQSVPDCWSEMGAEGQAKDGSSVLRFHARVQHGCKCSQLHLEHICEPGSGPGYGDVPASAKISQRKIESSGVSRVEAAQLRRIIESLRLEKTSKFIKSNC